MKFTTKFHFNKQLAPLALVVVTCLLIGILGSHLYIGHQFPLRDPQKRIALILALLLAWMLKFVFLDSASGPRKDAPAIAQMLHSLKGHFLGALRFLKKTIIDKHGYSTPLNKLPWYLLIGPPSSGKTTLLAYSNINFILAKQYKKEGEDNSISPSSVCEWWVTRDLVVVDVPGCYNFSPAKESLDESLKNGEKTPEEVSSKPHSQLILWKSLLNLLTKYRQKNNIGAIIVALQLPELIKQSKYQQNQWLQDLKDRLNECWHKFGNLPVYFVITKCDLLPGFSEFFNDIGSDELSQPWGIPLSARKEHENLLDIFTQRFNGLVKRLNKQLIWRLHQERNPDSRPLIKDFPLQMEFLKENLSHILKMLQASNPKLDLEGIYLTSTIQENSSSSATTLFHQDLPEAVQTLSPTPFISRTFFVKHIISYLLPHTSHHLAQRFRHRKTWLPQLAYVLAFSLLFLGALSVGRDFQRGLYQVSSIQRYLSQYQLYIQQNGQAQSLDNLGNAEALLNSLHTASLVTPSSSSFENIQNFYTQKSQQTAIAIYQKALNTLILPPLRAEFEKYLQNADDKKPEQLYRTLKAYLLLEQKDSILSASAQADFILKSLQDISPNFNSKNLNKDLQLHVQNALLLKQANSLDKKLIRETRKTLNSLPEIELAYLLLQDANSSHADIMINLGTNIGTPPALLSKGNVTHLPYLFTASAFPLVIKEQIPLLAKQTILGNDILGNKPLPADSLVPATAMIASLSEQLEKDYLKHYIDTWETLVDNISLNQPKDLMETDALILNLISSHSPLLQLLQSVHSNTDLAEVLANSSKLQALNLLFKQTESKDKNSLYQIFVDLHDLHLSLESPTLNPAEPSALPQIRSVAEKYPEPIKGWLLSLVSTTQSLLAEAKMAKPSKKLSAETAKNNAVVEIIPEAKKKTLAASSDNEKEESATPSEPSILKKVRLSPYKKLIAERAAAASTAKKPEAEAKKLPSEKQEASNNSPHGEYVNVTTVQNHPLIFVMKD